MLQLFWYCFDLNKSDEEKITQYFSELTTLLQKAPTYVKLIAKPVPDKATTEIEKILRRSHPEFNKYLDELCQYCQSKEHYICPLLICCEENAQVAITFRNSDESGLAKWGGTLGCFGLAWKLNNKYAVWHEVLHIFGALECYTPGNNGPTCELNNCIMQYIPTKKSVGSWPFLCRKNVELIQDWIKKYASGD